MVDRILPRVERLGKALTDDDHAFRAVPVAVLEVATFPKRHTERVSKNAGDTTRNFARKS